jgi:hypothetical protein
VVPFCWDDQIKEDEMDGEHSTHGRCYMHTKLLSENLKGDHLDDLDTDKKTKLILKKVGDELQICTIPQILIER